MSGTGSYSLTDLDNRHEFLQAAAEVVLAWFGNPHLPPGARMSKVEMAIGDLRDAHPDVAIREGRWADIDWDLMGETDE